MTRINTNLSSLLAQTALQNSNNQLQTSLTRLSTGLQINSGADNPAGLIASDTFGAEITQINQSISNAQQATNIVSTADAALAQVSSQLNTILGLVQASANKGAISSSEIAANQVQVDSALQSIETIGQTTVFGGSQLLNGSLGFNVSGSLGSAFQSTTDIQVNSFDPALHTGAANNDVSLAVTQSAEKATVNVVGNSQVAGGSSSLANLSLDAGTTRTTSTLSANNFNLASATSNGLNDLTTDATRTTQLITGASLSTLAGSGASSLTLAVTGDLGSANVTVDASALAGGNTAALTTAINTVSSQTGVVATGGDNAGGNVTLNSSFVGAGALASVTATASTGGSHTTDNADLSGVNFAGFAGTGGTLDFTVNVDGAGATAVHVADTSALTGNTIATAINTAIGSNVASFSGGHLTITSPTVGPTGSVAIGVVGNTGGSSSALDATALNTALQAGVNTPGVTDATTFNAAVGVAAAGTNSAGIGNKTSVFTITGNEGSATISTAALSFGGLTGNDVIVNNNSTAGGAAKDGGLKALATLINTRTGSTGVTASVNTTSNSLVLTSGGAGSTSLAGITAAGGDASLINSTNTTTKSVGTDGTSNTVTYQINGDLGNAYITVANNSVVDDSNALANAINGVSAQTGVTASSAGGAGANVTLTSQNYGSTAKASISAISATNQADINLINSANTQTSTAGVDAAGTVTTNKSSGAFQAQGAEISYADNFINLKATTAPSLSAPTAATSTVEGGVAGSGGIGSLTGTDADTIDFAVTGALGTVNIQGINVAALQGDSRVLADAINKVSGQTGVTASTTASGGSFAGTNIVLSASEPGSLGSVSITSTGSTNGTDNGVFNQAATQTAAAAGTDAPATATAHFNVTGGALFQIGTQVNFQNQVNVNIAQVDVATLGSNFSTTGTASLQDLKTGGSDALSASDLTQASAVVSQAINQVATLRGQLGALQSDILNSNITSLQTSLEQVTSAQSSIQDADFASETANLTRAQILVQAGTSVLSIANNRPQSVLSLLPKS